MPTPSLPRSLTDLLMAFSPCFTAPTMRTFQALVAGFLTQPGQRTVIGLLVGARLAGRRHHDLEATRMSRVARLLTLVAVLAAVVILAGSASAATITEDRALTAVELQAGAYTLVCPSGERIVSAEASFYRTAKHKNPLGADLAPTMTTSDANGNPVTATWALPKAAKYVQATLVCEPIPPTFQPVSFSGTFVAGQTVRVDCPTATPYLWSVLQVDAIDPSTGQPVALGYTYVYPTGIEVYPSYPGLTWQITLTCTNQPPA